MQEHGKIIAVLAPQQGVSQRSGQPWYSQSYVLEIDGRYTRRVAFSLWGLEANQKANLQIGSIVDVFCEVEAHEFQGKWFNEVRCYDVMRNGQSMIRGNYVPAQPQQAQPIYTNQQPANIPTAPTGYPDMGPMAQQQMAYNNQPTSQPMPTPQVPPINPRPYDANVPAGLPAQAPY